MMYSFKHLKGYKMDEAIQKLTELNALLLALTGGLGTDELEAHHVDAILNVCQRLSHEALQGFKQMGILPSPVLA